MDKAILNSAIEKAVRTGIQVITGAGVTEATGADLTTTAGILQFIITTVVTALVMAYATPTREDVKKKAEPKPVEPGPATDVGTASPEDILGQLQRIPDAALDELRKKFGR